MYRMAIAITVVWAIAGSSPAIAQNIALTVRTESGLVSGNGNEIRAFRGIPYAAAPIGDLRWRAPRPAPAWQGVRDGSTFGPDCVQPSYYPELRGTGQSEDCLTLNVWTPAKQTREALPVMVWIYGGGFISGSGSHPSYEGMSLAGHGVVLVTLNYRMGLFGFMAHPALTAESPSNASGNYGLMDQVAALQWVKRNVVAFGGDPNRVTVFGQSAGAMSIEALMTSPLADGLFQQAVLESVGAMRPMSNLNEAEAFGLQIGEKIEDLRAMTSNALVQRLKELLKPERDVTARRILGTIVDGYVIPRADYVAFSNGEFRAIPLIVGSNANEGAALAGNISIDTQAAYKNYLARNFPNAADKAEVVYPVESDGDVRRQIDLLFGDTQFNYGTRDLLRFATARQPKTYRYLFTRGRNGTTAEPTHGDELQYVFGTLDAEHKGKRKPFNDGDIFVSAQMQNAWVNFAKTGDPNGGDLPKWPPYEAKSEPYLNFGTKIVVGSGSRAEQLDFIAAYYASLRH